MASTKRIAKEFADCTTAPPPGISITLPSDADLHTWHVTVTAPPNSVYAPGRFGLILKFPVDYPFKPPTINFTTRIYHPNITNDSLGNICIGLLKSENWKPASKVINVLEAVRNILVEPMPDDALEQRIADEYRRDRPEFEKNARAYVERYAKGTVNFVQAPPPPEQKDGGAPAAGGATGAANPGRAAGRQGGGSGLGSASRPAPPA
ncbi:ubiquitin-conjugating enzyme/RWD-like protein [Neurospora tetraspora]|uniref:E2 ubiquitin-conjugating enzyme n=1 Tax=Neurospora tetraspora TaxID=94610 RepID=A0AAE0MQA0_9PEZI|nr:ubiquitin-conjugating enzyme/RWD-like protein [Neurospora tetraspora]